jgi:hypothetical protein
MDTLNRTRFVCQLVDARLLSPGDGIDVLNAPASAFVSELAQRGIIVETR